MDRELVDQPGPEVLLTGFGAAHHRHVLLPGGGSGEFEGAFDPFGDEGVDAPLGHVVGQDEDRDAGGAGRAVSAPPGDRVVVGAPSGDHRTGTAREHLAVALVVAEGPLVMLMSKNTLPIACRLPHRLVSWSDPHSGPANGPRDSA